MDYALLKERHEQLVSKRVDVHDLQTDINKIEYDIKRMLFDAGASEAMSIKWNVVRRMLRDV